jgi:16S rRNA G966 N2-methylase RsmD
MTNLKEFINMIVQYNDITSILNEYDTQSEKGFIYERLWDICIKLGFCPIFPNSIYKHKIGNSNLGKLKTLKNLDKYLTENKVFSGNSNGCSDITLKNKDNNTYIFISSKFPKSSDDIQKQKSVNYYDIQNIIAMAYKNKHIYKKYEIYLMVPDKNTLLNKIKNSRNSSNYITEHMKEDNILDKSYLNMCFLMLKNDIIMNKKNNDIINYNIYGQIKENLNLRFHQELITQKTCDLIEKGNKSFLWGCKCRSGKTYMVGGIIIKQFNVKKKLNVLIITPAPTETIPQFTEELFNKFKDFYPFKIHYNCLDICENNNIFVLSKQFLQKYINLDTIDKIKKLKLDLIVFDENHAGGTTNLSKEILTSYSLKKTVKIYLTATYQKPLIEWEINRECQMYWDIEDEQICKSICDNENNLDKLKEKYGHKPITKILNYYKKNGINIKDIFTPYLRMPEMHLITNMFDSQRYEDIKEKLNTENKMGFCFDTLLSLNPKKTRFNYEQDVQTILRYISGAYKEDDGEKTIFTRIKKICNKKETRYPFTQIWFLPPNNINQTSLCLKSLMKNDPILKKYSIMCINRKNKDLAKDIKGDINKKEIESKEKGKSGLILLTGHMLTLGITLNNCDLVMLINNTLSSDKILQEMYRCMTEGDNKKFGFVVDLNISRVLNTCVNYTIFKEQKNINEKMKYLIEHHLINIDVDMMENKNISSNEIVKKLMDIWKEDPINSFRTLLRRLDNDYGEFDNDTQKLININFNKSLKDNTIYNCNVIFKNDDEIQKLPDGKEKIKNDDNSNDIDNIDDKKKDIEIQISFTKDVLPYIIPLTCILTIKNSNMDFVKMLNDIKENPELLETFDDQCLIWWNKKGLIDLIKDIITKYFDKKSNTYNISIQFKMSLQSLIDRPKELLELINECLKPKEIEKKKFGEVFTPMNLVNEMLDRLPKDVWKNKRFKWFDPATGMGNFPIAVYLRLMKGLKKKIKDEEERKKHILEKMLYMSEINKKNVLVCKQIFDINNEYKLNIYQGDTLKLNVSKIFGISKFDIIMANPPYNSYNNITDKMKRGGNNNLYEKFINFGIEQMEKNGYLLYITPTSWFSISKKNQKLREIILKNKILYIDIATANKKYFQSVGNNFVWFLIKNSSISNENNYVKVKCLYNKEIYESDIDQELFNIGFIPLLLNNTTLTIINKIINNKNNKIYAKLPYEYEPRKSHVVKIKPKISEKSDIIVIRSTKGKKLYSTKITENCKKYKVIIPSTTNYEKMEVTNDCTTQSFINIVCSNENEANKIKNMLMKIPFRFFNNLCRWGNWNYADVISLFPNLSNYISTDDNIEKKLKLTKNEIDFMKKIIKIKT